MIKRSTIKLLLPVTTLLLVAMTTPVALARHGQQILDREISVDLQNVPLILALNEIEAAAAVKFVYSPSQLDLSQIISIRADRQKLGIILNDLFGPLGVMYTVDQSKEYILLKPLRTEVKVPPVEENKGEGSQNYLTVTGTVTDAVTGTPIAGVNIVKKGTTMGTTTDSDGAYTINAEDEDVLIYSFIGYRKFETPVGGRILIDVALEEEIASLKEIVVNAGYYLTTDRQKTGNISKITEQEIKDQTVASPLLTLQGRMPGVDVTQHNGVPGNAIKILIRGQNSIRGNANYPLYIINGVPVNPSPLPTNGLSLVSASYDPLSTINPYEIESIEVLKDADATSIYGSRGANGVVLITTKQATHSEKTDVDINIFKGVGFVSNRMNLLTTAEYVAMRKEAYKNDARAVSGSTARDLLLWDTTRYTDWQKKFIAGTSDITNAQASISGGDKNTSFRLGGGFYKETTVFPGDFGFARMNGHIILNHLTPDQKFSASISLNYGLDKNNLFNANLVSEALRLAPNAPELYDENGNLNWENSTWTNPMAGVETTQDASTKNLLINSTLSLSLLPGLTAKANLGLSDLASFELIKYPISAQNPAFSGLSANNYISDVFRKSWIIEPQLEFVRTISGGTMTALLGSTWQESSSKSTVLFGHGYEADVLLGNINAAPNLIVSSYDESKYRYNSLFARFGYNLRDKYLLNLTGRMDGSSRFGPGKRIGKFGAIGLAWIFSSEDFIKNNFAFVSFGKIRTSYGTTGNDQIGDYQYLDTYNIAFNNYQENISLLPTSVFNPDYSWETTTKAEAAIELSLIDNRIHLMSSWYRNLSSNQLAGHPLPTTTGFTTVTYNLPASVENKGWEMEIRALLTGKQSFSWSASFNVTLPKNQLAQYENLEQSVYANTYVVGKPLDIMKLYKSTGVSSESGTYQFSDINGDGEISDPEDRTLIQHVGRDFYGGINNSFQLKKWEVNFLFQFIKQDMQNYLRFFGVPGTFGNNQPNHILDRWLQVDQKSSIQKFTTRGTSSSDAGMAATLARDSDLAISDASFIRLKSVSIAYTFDTRLISALGIKSLKAYAQAQNLFTISGNFIGMDPETGVMALPPLSMISFGLELKL